MQPREKGGQGSEVSICFLRYLALWSQGKFQLFPSCNFSAVCVCVCLCVALNDSQIYRAGRLSPQNIPITSKRILVLISSHCIFPPATTNLLSVSVDLLFLHFLYVWNHTICDLLCLASFAERNVFEVHLQKRSVLYSFLLPNSTLLCRQTTFCLSIHQLMNI